MSGINLGSAYGTISIGTDQAQKSITSLSDTMRSAGTSMSLGITAPLVGIAAMALSSAGDFEQSMNVMAQVSGATADQMATLQSQALEMGAATSFSAGEAAQAQLELAKAGLSVNDIISATPGVLAMAAAGGMGLAESAEIAANAMNAFNLPASEMPNIANMLAAAANASGDSVNIIAGTLYADYTAVVTSNSSVVDTDPITIGMVDNGLTAIAANYVNAGPASGSAAVPSYRALVPADIPTAVQSEWTNKLINPMFRTWGHAITSPVTITDGAYSGPTGWFFLTQNTSVEITSGSGLSNSSHSVIITNQNASSRRAGTSQFVEYYDTLSLRGKTVTFSIKAKCSNAKNVRAALINWTGTANAPTKDVVNDWASTTYTEGNFFISSGSLDIIAVSSAVSVGTSATEITVTGAVGASTTNLQVIVWTEDALAEDQTIELSEAMLVKGSYSVEFDAPYYPQEMIDCEYRCRTVASDASQTDAIIGWGHGASTTVAVCQVPLGHGMRVVPSLTYTAADWQVADSVGSRQDVTALAISTTVSSRKILFLTSTVASGLTVGRGMATVADTTSGRFLKFDAEIGV